MADIISIISESSLNVNELIIKAKVVIFCKRTRWFSMLSTSFTLELERQKSERMETDILCRPRYTA